MSHLLSLPPEIITEIFVAIVAQGCSPIPFTHVNSWLRNIGISSSELWTSFRIRSSIYFKEAERGRIRHYLQRSQNRSIDVAFDIPNTLVDRPDALKIYEQCLPRAKRLTLSGDFPRFFTTSFSGPAPRLIHLDMHDLRFSKDLGSVIPDAPNLSTLGMSLMSPKDLGVFNKIQCSLRCLNLEVRKDGQFALSSISGIVHNQAGSLVDLELDLPKNILHPEDAEFMRVSSPIEMPSLRRLALWTSTTQLLGKITAPSLETFFISVNDEGVNGGSVEMNPDDLPCLLNFLVKHSHSLVDIDLNSPSDWPHNEEIAAQPASPPRSVVFFLRLRVLNFSPSFADHLFETIASATLEILFIIFLSPFDITWVLLISFLRHNSMSLKDIKIASGSVVKDPIRLSASNGDDNPPFSLPNLKNLYINCAGGGNVLASIHSAPLLEYLDVFSPILSEFHDELGNHPRSFPSLHTVRLIDHLELLTLIDAPTLKQVVLGSRKTDPSHASAVLGFLQRHAHSITSLVTSGEDLNNIVHFFRHPSKPIFGFGPPIDKFKLTFPLLETLAIRSDDGLIPYFTTMPKL